MAEREGTPIRRCLIRAGKEKRKDERDEKREENKEHSDTPFLQFNYRMDDQMFHRTSGAKAQDNFISKQIGLYIETLSNAHALWLT